jgi:DNA-binding transcriptional LysR family regulator
MDLNLLIALDALLDTRSVSLAAQRLHLSAPAMSRTLTRIRKATGDPVLVRTGRTMTPTPRALEIQVATRELIDRAQEIFAVPGEPDLPRLTRDFSILASDLGAALGPQILGRIRSQAPGVTLRFLGESAMDGARLRDGEADLEIGVIVNAPPDITVMPLGDYAMGLAVRIGHPLTRGKLTPARVAAAEHVSASRRGVATGPLDAALTTLGLHRTVVAVVPSITEALLMVSRTDLVGLMPYGPGQLTPWVPGVMVIEAPVKLPLLPLSQAWHRRFDNDGAHRWLRGCVAECLS